MQHKTTTVPVLNLNAGMILGDDFFDSNGSCVVSKGVILNDSIVSRLKERFPYKLACIQVELAEDVMASRNSRVKRIVRTEVCLKQLSNGIKSVIRDVQSSGKLDSRAVEGMSVQLLENFKDYSIVLESIVKERSLDEYIQRHCVNVSVLSIMLGRWLGFTESELMMLAQSALLHDIGKVKIDERILNKPGCLTRLEFTAIKRHSILGYELVKDIGHISPMAASGILMHHEKIDGSGYPLGLRGDEISPFAKIIAVADIFDAITSKRPYKGKESPFHALEVLKSELCGKLDPLCLTTFLQRVSMFYIGEYVRLSNGKVAKIVKINHSDISRPLVMAGSEFIDLSRSCTLEIVEIAHIAAMK